MKKKTMTEKEFRNHVNRLTRNYIRDLNNTDPLHPNLSCGDFRRELRREIYYKTRSEIELSLWRRVQLTHKVIG